MSVLGLNCIPETTTSISKLCAVTLYDRRASPKRLLYHSAAPVCGGDNLQPVERDSVGTAEADTKNIFGVLGFRCGKGHVFLVTEADIEEKNPKSC
jgi:hypothetical protein